LELAHDRHNYAATASRILGESLKPLPGMAKINLTLDRFAHNLEKLVRMDKLSSPQNGGISCYQAIFGVYTSLRKLFDHEKKMALALMDAKDPRASYKAEREVLCKKSGRPRLNAGNRLGLSLEYWMDRRHLFEDGQGASSPKDKDKMDIDPSPSDYPEDKDPSNHKIYSVTIECESSPSSMYTPIRISDNWISDAVEKAPDAPPDMNTNNSINVLLGQNVKQNLDWQDPPATYLPSASAEGDNAQNNDALNIANAEGRLPNIRFVAKFNPPLVLPLTVLVTIRQQFGLEIGEIHATTFAGLVLRPGAPDPGIAAAMPGTATQESPHIYELQSTKAVVVPGKNGETETDKTHQSSLYIPRGTEYAGVLESLPFAHPRQLIDIFPTLRQYAFVTSLMQRGFGPDTDNKTNTPAAPQPISPPATPSAAEDLAQQREQQLDVSLYYAPPAPRLRIDIPRSAPSEDVEMQDSDAYTPATAQADLLNLLLGHTPPPQPISVTLDVLANAEVVVTGGNVAVGGVDGGGEAKEVEEEREKRVARALEICMDVDVWAEWVRREVGA
jgi:hypothetical protein